MNTDKEKEKALKETATVPEPVRQRDAIVDSASRMVSISFAFFYPCSSVCIRGF
jgi:hypothetical protein